MTPTIRTHTLKTWPSFFEAVLSGEKTFEVRKNDRDFQTGDLLILEECSRSGIYSGRKIEKHVTYVLRGGAWGIEQGYCVLGLEVCNVH